ncbi:hypothetical protein F0562_006673 [Nyssa sinensis]|uniref:Retrovirus-related Pol polyprotein from transposon TNT 1-94 n=1 Tax=Nyssa sinensis TaxID=561372 RepID=A0A5J5AM66_9ASTE|nr:hypothetical protein F0562_006673 [Nyssa sinensis]
MKDLLIQQGVHMALEGKAKKPEKMSNDTWVEMDEKETTSIRLNMFDELIHNMINVDTIEDIWKKLESLYMVRQLVSCGANLEDEDQAILLLASLPSLYNHLVTMMLYKKEALDLEEVTGGILSHQKMRKTVDDESQAKGLVAKLEHKCDIGR